MFRWSFGHVHFFFSENKYTNIHLLAIESFFQNGLNLRRVLQAKEIAYGLNLVRALSL